MPREILFEITLNGAYAKASAIDAESGVEAAVVLPSRLSETQLKQAALRKLERKLSGPIALESRKTDSN